ncbi:phosphatidate cytidylyltransferase [Microbacteriaceae bacterium K1510]|nr:phosphatidate cytidylyltransferase [Microbacteriaceae bacterium K1510]
MTNPVSGTAPPVATSNLVLRIASAVVLAPVAVAAAYFGGWAFAVFWGLAAIAILWEWTTLVAGAGHRVMFASAAVALAITTFLIWLHRPITSFLLVGLGAFAAAIFAPRRRRGWVIAGVVYAGMMLLAPVLLRADEEYGLFAIGLLFAVVWSTDIFAYFAGRTFGGPKLCPAISPKKTWSGAIAGTIAAVLIAIGLARYFGSTDWIAIGLLALVLSMVSQVGDLLESSVKRHFGAKDASHLIPGHGGVMDRLDSFWAAVVVACLIGLTRGGFDHAARGLLDWSP